MKSLYTTMYSALLMGAIGLNATAQQQLPNVGFEEAWVDCIPWTSTDPANTKVQGQNPTGWCVSNVIGMGGTGATTVGAKTEGYESLSAIKLTNSPNPIMKSQIVPAYITLGTTWSTAVSSFSFSGIKVSNSDGGSFGGMAFTGRPKSLEFMYKRSRGTDTSVEKTTIVAYLWKGHWTQADVPGNIVMGKPTTTTMTDRDRCVLGMSMDGCQGGAVTKDADAVLIGKLEAYITENTNEWTKFSADFEYLSDETPEYINVIIAAGDYFGGASVVEKDNSLTVDDVKLLYAETPTTEEHDGYLNIVCKDMGNEENPDGILANNSPTKIEIIPTGDNTCTFKLPDFTLGTGENAMPLGDIVVENVIITEKDGVKTYSGVAKDMNLMGMITADVTINGTIEGDDVNMKIDVIWTNSPMNEENRTPIYVTFNSKPVTTGIADITVDNSNAPVEFYNLQGIRVNGDNLTPGIYVRRQGSAVSKILVK